MKGFFFKEKANSLPAISKRFLSVTGHEQGHGVRHICGTSTVIQEENCHGKLDHNIIFFLIHSPVFITASLSVILSMETQSN